MKTKEILYADVCSILKKYVHKSMIKSDYKPLNVPHTDKFVLHLSDKDSIILTRRKPRKYTINEQSLMMKYNIHQSDLNNLLDELHKYFRQLNDNEFYLINGISVFTDI